MVVEIGVCGVNGWVGGGVGRWMVVVVLEGGGGWFSDERRVVVVVVGERWLSCQVEVVV